MDGERRKKLSDESSWELLKMWLRAGGVRGGGVFSLERASVEFAHGACGPDDYDFCVGGWEKAQVEGLGGRRRIPVHVTFGVLWDILVETPDWVFEENICPGGKGLSVNNMDFHLPQMGRKWFL